MKSPAAKPSLRESTSVNQNLIDPKLDHAPWGNPMTPISAQLPQLKDPQEFAKDLVLFVEKQSEADVGPFYEYLLSGQLSLTTVQEWVKQLYFDARCFPPLIAQIVANAHYQYDIRQIYGLNLAEELGEYNPLKEHPILLLKFGRALGLTNEEMEFAKPLPEVLMYVEYRSKLVRDSSALEGIAAGSLTIESTIVRRYKKIIAAMKKHYNIKDEDLEYFYIHSGGTSENDYGGDWAHAGEAMDFIKKYAVTAELQEKCRQAVWRSVEARKVYQWGLFHHLVLKHDDAYKAIVTKHKTEYKKVS